ncbi:MAG: hypothetical protein Q9184_006789 [Pyrenodesmia sp. 2 TL-2023]
MSDDTSTTRSVLHRYLISYGLLRPLRRLIKKHYQPVPEEIRNRGEDRKSLKLRPPRFPLLVPGFRKPKDRSSLPANTGTGYLHLPPELRNQIMEQSLVTESIWPHRGEAARETWLRDFDIAGAAHRQAFKNFVRHPSPRRVSMVFRFYRLYVGVALRACPTTCHSTKEVAPHFLSLCRATYTEGHALFYSLNTFHLPHGPLSNTKAYYDTLSPAHRRLIRKMVLDIITLDLTLDAIDDIEAQLRAKDHVNGRLPPDTSTTDWVPAIVYNIICTWRTKLAWLRDWTWLENVTIRSSLSPWPSRGCTNHLVYPKCRGRQLPKLLRGVGPVETHMPILDCYGECPPGFADQMRRMEAHLWSQIEVMIGYFGWACTKALVRRVAYEKEELW